MSNQQNIRMLNELRSIRSSHLEAMRKAVKVHDDDLVGLFHELPHVLNDDVERVHFDEIVH